MARLIDFLTVATATLGLCATALAIDLPNHGGSSTVYSRALMEENKAAQARMEAFDLRLKGIADRAIQSICTGCLPNEIASASSPPSPVARQRPVRVALVSHPQPPRARRVVQEAAPRAPTGQLRRLILASFLLPED